MDKTLKIEPQGDLDIVMTRWFAATPEQVFEAHTNCKYVSKWLLGPDGWTMPHCEIDLRVGGKYRYVWAKADKNIEMGMGGEFREIERPHRIVATEKFDESWYEGEAIDTSTFVEVDGGTLVTLTMSLQSKEARDGVLTSGMDSGVKVSYDRLDDILSSAFARGA